MSGFSYQILEVKKDMLSEDGGALRATRNGSLGRGVLRLAEAGNLNHRVAVVRTLKFE